MVKRQKKDVHQIITNQVLDAIDYAKANNIKLNWTKSWKSGKAISRPLRSVPFGTPYKGINALLLMMSASINGFDSPYFMTFKQAQELGGKVIKGSKHRNANFLYSFNTIRVGCLFFSFKLLIENNHSSFRTCYNWFL